MKIHTLYNSALGVGLALFISRITPPRLGYAVAGWVSTLLAKRSSADQVKAVRLNQWVVSGKSMDEAELNLQSKKVFNSAAKSIFDFYHNMNNPKKILGIVDIKPDIKPYFSDKYEQNAVFVAPHISNFEIVGRALGLSGYRLQILSFPNPGSGYQWQNRIRVDVGHRVTPTSVESLREARIRLRNGENVLTGFDRPIASNKYMPNFFGHPANLPVAYTRLALQANAPVVLVSAISKPNGRYLLHLSDPIEMKSYKDLTEEMILNTEAVLHVAEQLIKENADQWAMFYPVWPSLMSSVP